MTPPSHRPRFLGRVAGGVLAATALLLASCASGTLATSNTSPVGTPSPITRPSASGPTLVVTVPELVLSSQGPAPVTLPPTTDAATASAGAPSASEEAPPEAAETEATDEATDGATAQQIQPPPAAEPSGEGLNVSLANCDGCTVLATHRAAAGGRSAALVSTGSGRAILLSVGADGQVAGVIGVPYGAAFSPPGSGVLPCAQGRCVVTGRQTDGRAILSAFALTDSGAWRDVSGDDAFPSATERSAVIDLDGEPAIAVQDQGNGSAVWMLYTWGGDRYSVLGCAPDGDPPATAAAVSPATCLS